MAGRMDYVADSEEEDMLVDPWLEFANTSTAAESVQTADTSLFSPLKNNADSGNPSLSQPPIAILPEATASSSSSASIPSHARAPHNVARSRVSGAHTATVDPSVPSAAGASAAQPPKPRPRPRPRPTYKVNPTDNDAPTTTAASDISSFSNDTGAGLSAPLQDLAPGWSPGAVMGYGAQLSEVSLFSNISERAKMRSRARTAEMEKKAAVVAADVIELTSSDDELSCLSPPKSKAKAKAKAKEAVSAPPLRRSPKRAKLANDVDVPSSTMNTIPVPTSEFPSLSPSSILPPSDPPGPSSSSLPPTSHPGLAQSPPSSPIPMPVRKRKRPAFAPPPDDDDEEELEQRHERESQKLMPPPPVPGASSSRAPPPPAVESPKEQPKTKARSRKKAVAVEEEEEDWTGDPKPKPKAKARAPRRGKKQVEQEGEEEKSPAKQKGKGKAKTVVPSAIVEVVLERRSSASPTKHHESAEDHVEPSVSRRGSTSESALTELGDEEETGRGKVKSTSGSVSASDKGKGKGKGKASRRAVMLLSSDDEGAEASAPAKASTRQASEPKEDAKDGNARSTPPPDETLREPDTPSKALARASSLKENSGPKSASRPKAPTPSSSSTVPATPAPPRSSSVIPKSSASTPMSELIRRANSKPGSPFASASAYSPYAKSSRTMLKRIAPLHVNRRTPPPPPPRPPPPKKTKKQLQLEEQWETELEETVEGWVCLSEEERAALRRAKRDAVMGFDD